MTADEYHNPVPGFPSWHWWTGVTGILYARRPKTSPPWVVRARDFASLVEKVRTEARKRAPGAAA